PLEDGFVQVVSTKLTALAVRVEACGGEDPLPSPFGVGVGVLAGQGEGERDAADTLLEVSIVLLADAGDVRSEGCFHFRGQDSDAILLSLSAADSDFASLEVDVVDAELAALGETEPG